MPKFFKSRAPQILPTAAAMIVKRRNERRMKRMTSTINLPLLKNFFTIVIHNLVIANHVNIQFISPIKLVIKSVKNIKSVICQEDYWLDRL